MNGWMCSVVGCPDLQTNDDVEVQYSADRSVAAVTCRRRTLDVGGGGGGGGTAAASWRLACSDRGWHGYIGNCTAGSALIGAFYCNILRAHDGGSAAASNVRKAAPLGRWF